MTIRTLEAGRNCEVWSRHIATCPDIIHAMCNAKMRFWSVGEREGTQAEIFEDIGTNMVSLLGEVLYGSEGPNLAHRLITQRVVCPHNV